MGTRLQFPKPRELAACSDPVIDVMIENLGGDCCALYLACPADEVRADALGGILLAWRALHRAGQEMQCRSRRRRRR